MVIDVGCGSGQVTKLLAKYFKKAIGIDVSQAQINEAKNMKDNPDNIDFR